MVRTTPPRPVDVVALFPDLARFRRQTVRLHPRAGAPTTGESSIGGPLRWPAEEAWPICPGPHLSDPATLTVPLSAAPTDSTPNAMIPLAQIFARDLPATLELPGFAEADLLQVLWCPIDHPGTYVPRVQVHWRQSASIGVTLLKPPAPTQLEDDYVPAPCVLHPELVTELPDPWKFPPGWDERVWEHAYGSVAEQEIDYQYDLSVAPGWKLGGWGSWSFSDPFEIACDACGAAMVELLTVSSGEWDGGSRSWIPVEDRETRAGANEPGVWVGRGYNLQVYTCPADVAHPVQSNLQ